MTRFTRASEASPMPTSSAQRRHRTDDLSEVLCPRTKSSATQNCWAAAVNDDDSPSPSEFPRPPRLPALPAVDAEPPAITGEMRRGRLWPPRPDLCRVGHRSGVPKKAISDAVQCRGNGFPQMVRPIGSKYRVHSSKRRAILPLNACYPFSFRAPSRSRPIRSMRPAAFITQSRLIGGISWLLPR